MTSKLDIASEMRALDRKERNFFDDLTDEERRKFSPFLMIRWGSSVQGSRELQEFYVIATNERLNKHFFSVNTVKHKKLQWLMATTISPNMGVHRHVWIAPKKKESASSKKKQLAELFPQLKDDDITALAAITSDEDIKQYIKDHGHDAK